MTWATRERPVLEAILAVEEADRDRVMTVELAETVGLADAEVQRAVRALIEDGFLAAKYIGGGVRGSMLLIMPRLRGKARRAVGQWPADGFDALVALLDQQIRDEPDAAKRSRLERFRDSVLGIGRDVVTEVLGKLATGGLGI